MLFRYQPIAETTLFCFFLLSLLFKQYHKISITTACPLITILYILNLQLSLCLYRLGKLQSLLIRLPLLFSLRIIFEIQIQILIISDCFSLAILSLDSAFIKLQIEADLTFFSLLSLS